MAQYSPRAVASFEISYGEQLLMRSDLTSAAARCLTKTDRWWWVSCASRSAIGSSFISSYGAPPLRVCALGIQVWDDPPGKQRYTSLPPTMSFLRRNDQPKIPPVRNDDTQYEANRAALFGTGGGYPVSKATVTFRMLLNNIRIVAVVFPLAPELNVCPAIVVQVTDDMAGMLPEMVTATLHPRTGTLATRLTTN